jgi:hypothetical protein
LARAVDRREFPEDQPKVPKPEVDDEIPKDNMIEHDEYGNPGAALARIINMALEKDLTPRFAVYKSSSGSDSGKLGFIRAGEETPKGWSLLSRESFRGDLTKDQLGKKLNELIHRAPILRTEMPSPDKIAQKIKKLVDRDGEMFQYSRFVDDLKEHWHNETPADGPDKKMKIIKELGKAGLIESAMARKRTPPTFTELLNEIQYSAKRTKETAELSRFDRQDLKPKKSSTRFKQSDTVHLPDQNKTGRVIETFGNILVVKLSDGREIEVEKSKAEKVRDIP